MPRFAQRPPLAGAAAFAAVAALGLADGGYFPTAWGWSALALAGGAAAALLLGAPPAPSRLELAFVGLLAGLVLWTGLSVLWSVSVPSSVHETERGLLYVAAAAVLLALGRSGPQRGLVTGLAAGAGAVAVGNVLLRDPATRGGIAEPVGYENALAILLVLGILLSGGIAAASPRLATRAAAAALLVLLLAQLRPLDSRGAWVALGVGVCAALVVRLVRAPLAFPAAVAAGLVVATVAAASSPGDRPRYWRVALAEAASAPAVGTGAGTFHAAWLRERRVPLAARDAHNLYLETLTELGPVGLALLVGALALPLAAAGAIRGDPFAPAAGGAYAAFLVHAGVDWDWEMPCVTVAGLACGVALLLAARTRERALTERRRAAAAAVSVVVAVAAAWGLAGNAAVAAARASLADRQWAAAADQARIASWLAPWSAEPWLVRGEARHAQGRVAAARASLARAVEKDPSDPEAWLALARASEGPERDRAVAEAAERNPLGITAGS